MNRPVVIITGGGRGIGAATATSAAGAGYDVVISYRSNEAAASAVSEQVRASGGEALAVQADYRDEAQILHLFQRVDERFGRLDALVNNAGIAAPSMAFGEYSAQRMKEIFETNIFGPFVASREAVRRMSTSNGGDGGVIVNISSIAARIGSPHEYIDYAASKAAIDAMTTGLSKEVADQGIRVNSVRPGMINTDIHATNGRPDRVAQLSSGIPMQRGGEASEIAATVLWLLSDAASYVTGAWVDVGGGR